MGVVELAFNPPRFDDPEYDARSMRLLVDELERLHAALTMDVDDTGTGTVDDFNGRTGSIVPEQADYDSFFLTPAEGDALFLTPAEGNAAYADIAHTHSLPDLNDVVSATNTNRFALMANGTTGYVGRLLVEADISNLQSYLTAEVNDLTAAVTWANVPDANITQGSVTQHQAALTILESQITDANILARIAGNEIITGNWTYNVGSATSTVLKVGESSTLRGDAQDAVLQMYGENSSLIYGGQISVVSSNMTLSGVGANPVQSLQSSINIDVLTGNTLQLRDSTNAKIAAFSHGAADLNASFTGTANWNVINLGKMVFDIETDLSWKDTGSTIRDELRMTTQLTGGDPLWTDVVVLLHFDGTDGQTTTVDSGPDTRTVTLGNSAELDTAIVDVGSASCLFPDVANNRCSITAGTGDPRPDDALTMEFRYYPNSVTTIQCICGNRTSTDGWAIYQLATGELNIQGYASSSSKFSITSSVDPTISTWQDVAVTRTSGGVWTIWLDGVDVGNATESGVVGDTGSTTWIIGYDNSTAGRDLDGQIDEFRWTKGTGGDRYTENYTPITGAYPTGAGSPSDVFWAGNSAVDTVIDGLTTRLASVSTDVDGTLNVDGSSTFLDDVDVTGLLSASKMIAGDPGTEGTGITVNGTNYESVLKVSDIGGTNAAQFIMHRHSTTLPALLIGARSKSNTSAHTVMADNDVLMTILAAGWDGVDSYSLSSEIRFEVDGAPGANDMPGQITFMTSPDGAEAPVERMRIRADGDVEIDNDLVITGLVDGRDIDADGTALDAHIALTDEHIDWTADQNPTIIHVDNLAPDANSVSPQYPIVVYDRTSTAANYDTFLNNGIFGMGSSETNGPDNGTFNVLEVLRNSSDVRVQVNWPREDSKAMAYRGYTTVFGSWHYAGWTTTAANADLDSTFAAIGGAHHDGFSDFVAEEHIDWSVTGAEDIHIDRVPENSITSAKMANRVALSLMGRSSTIGVPQDLSAGSDGDIMRRSGAAIGFGLILAASISDFASAVAADEINDLTAAVTWANIPFANVPTGTSSSTVAIGDHLHAGVYLPLAGDTMTGSITVDINEVLGAIRSGGDGSVWRGQYPSLAETYSAAATGLANNAYVDPADAVSGQWRHSQTHASYGHAIYEQSAGEHRWYGNNNSVTADAIVSKQLRMTLSAAGALSVTGAVTGSNLNISDWDTAFGWGNHAGLYEVIDADILRADVIDHSDWQTSESGIATYTGSTNGPSGGTAYHGLRFNHSNDANYGTVLAARNNNFYFQSRDAGVWQGWLKVADTTFTAATYAALSHNHVIADVTDFTDNSTAWDAHVALTAEHIDWAVTGAEDIHIDRVPEGSITSAKMANRVAQSVMGRSSTIGTPQDLVASSDGDILRRSGTAVGFGSIVAASVSDFDTEVSNNSSVSANTSKVSNATHTGQVTGSVALALQIAAITDQPASGPIIATDTILTNDGGVLSETTFTQLVTYFNSALTMTEVNDLTASVTWANVPDANITVGSVTQHEASLTILESQITDSTILARVAAAETITAAWTFEEGLTIQDSLSTDWMKQDHDGANLTTTFFQTAWYDFDMNGLSLGATYSVLGVNKLSVQKGNSRVMVHDGWAFRIADSTDLDWCEMSHTGTDFIFDFEQTADVSFTGATSEYLFDQDVRLGSTKGLVLSGAGSDITFADAVDTARVGMVSGWITYGAVTGGFLGLDISDWTTYLGITEIRDGDTFRVKASGNVDYLQIAHDGTDSNITHNQTTDLNITGITDLVAVNYRLNVAETVGASQDNHVLTYDNSTGKIGLEVLPASGNGEVTKHKTADESDNNNNTVQNDDHIAFTSLDADTWYKVSGFFMVTGTTTTDWRAQWVFTQTPGDTGGIEHTGNNNAGTFSTDAGLFNGQMNPVMPSTGTYFYLMKGMFKTNATTGGDLQFKWSAQAVTGSNVTVHAGSWVTITPMT